MFEVVVQVGEAGILDDERNDAKNGIPVAHYCSLSVVATFLAEPSPSLMLAFAVDSVNGEKSFDT